MRFLLSTMVFLFVWRTTIAQDSLLMVRVDTLIDHAYSLSKTNPDQATSVANEALQLAVDHGYQRGESEALQSLGYFSLMNEKPQKALDFFYSALKVVEKDKNFEETRSYCHVLYSISQALALTRDTVASHQYANKAYNIAVRNNFKTLTGQTSLFIGEIYARSKKYDSASYFFEKAIAVYKGTKDLNRLSQLYNSLGVKYYYLEEYTTSLQYFRNAISGYQQMGKPIFLTPVLTSIGGNFLKLKSYDSALIYLNKAEQNAKTFKQTRQLEYIYNFKAELFTTLGVKDSIKVSYDNLIATMDSIFTEDYRKQLATVRTEFDVYRQQEENTLLKKEKDIANLDRNLAIAAFIAVFFILAFVLARQKIKVQKRVRARLENEVAERTAKVIKQAEVIEKVNLKLQLSLNRARVDPHFIFNVLNSIQHLVLEKKPVEASDHLAKLSRLTRYVLEKSCLDEVTMNEEITMLTKYITLEQLRLDNKFSFDIVNDAGEDILIPAMLIQPYVENAIMHGIVPSSQSNLKLALKIKRINDTIYISIEDNGIGRQNTKANGSHRSIGSSLGTERLQILSKLDQQHYEFKIEDLNPLDDKMRGTRVTLIVPLKSRQTVVGGLEPEVPVES